MQPEYLTYLDGLVDFIDEIYSTNQSAYARLHLGFSASGLASAYTIIERPEKFKLLASQSGAFWAGDEYGIKIQYLLATLSLDLKTWFSVGTYENNNSNETPMVNDTQRMVEICREKGWITDEVYNPECHSFGQWRHVLDEMLEFFFPYKGSTKKIIQNPIYIILPLIIIPILYKRKHIK